MSDRPLGIAGRLAAAFVGSKLTPLAIVASLMLGLFALVRLPREEEPQIKVPMVDVFVTMPGASPSEVEERVTRPIEQLLWEIPGVEYVYSTSSPGMSMVIVRFLVGQDEQLATVRLNDKLRANLDRIPQGVSPPLVKPRSIDDVPVLALTLSSAVHDSYTLRRVAAEVAAALKPIPDVSAVTLIGGERRQMRVLLDPTRLAAHQLSPLMVAQAIGAANLRLPSGAMSRDDRSIVLETGRFLRDRSDVERLVVGARDGRPVFLGDIATIVDGGEEPSTYVHHGYGAGHSADHAAGAGDVGEQPAVTLALAKRKGTNAITVVEAALSRLESLRGEVVPSDIDVTVTRDYGETAAEKSNELLFHMGIAVLSVALLIWLALGRREAVIVMLAIPATLALTLAVFYFYGYTLNRITLFALIFSIGILVDDAIVVVENITRHFQMPRNHDRDRATVVVEAVDEVGNPTILATLAVIAAILPMAFVGGLMGPYMRPIPVGASAAMLFSLLIAFIVTPWATLRLLRGHSTHDAEDRESGMTRLYRRVMGTLLHVPARRMLFLGGVAVLLIGSMALVPARLVQVKMLPFDNKSELQVIIDMPEGTTLERTSGVAAALAEVIRQQPEVVDYQSYVGTAGPFNFNGLVRHWFLRRGPSVADIQVNMVGKDERDDQSHDFARRLRIELAPIAARLGANIKIAEVPPGPPVLQTLVAEVYGPDAEGRLDLARRIRDRFAQTEGVVDVDWYVEADQPKVELIVDQEKAAISGVTTEAIARTLRVATAGHDVGLLHDPAEKEDVTVRLQLERRVRSDLDRLEALAVMGSGGRLVAIGELTRREQTVVEPNIYHKNLQPVVYVTADLAGAIESPVYAMLELQPHVADMAAPGEVAIEQYTARQPVSTEHYAVKWDGEWHITYEVFRDLGIAFAAVLILIYILVVAWFQSFWTPLVIMSAIPFSLVGILPAHALMGAFFTATSMIGFIAGAGIVVRNSIILVDFIELRRSEGMPLDEAVIDAGAVRFRPMVLTAAAVVVGAGVILFDPIFQGLAISLMAGEVASLLLSRMTVPVVYFLAGRAHLLDRPAKA